MKIIQLIAMIFLMTLGMTSANAMSVTFDLAGSPASSVAVTSFSPGFICWGCGINVALDSGLDSQQNSLSVGDSWTVPFFDITFSGAGAIDGTIAATLGFDSPAGAPGSTGSGDGIFAMGSLFGNYLIGAALTWNPQPGITTLTNGTSYSVVFENLHHLTFGSTMTVHAEITLLDVANNGGGAGHSVPEPGVLVLLGVGLVGLSFFSRRTKTQTYA